MKLLYDLASCQSPLAGTAHGGAKYGLIVFQEMIRQGVELECIYNSALSMREDITDLIKAKGIKLHDVKGVQIEDIINQSDADIFYSPLTRIKKPVREDVVICYTLHGLRDVEMPRDWYFLRYKRPFKITAKLAFALIFRGYWRRLIMKHTFERAERTNFYPVVVSEHTKYSCMAYNPNLKSEDLPVFYSPSTSSDNPFVKACDKYGDYILMVSASRPEKNSLRAIMAFEEILDERPELRHLKMVLTGANMGSFRYRFRHPENFVFPGYVSEDELDSLYAGAKLFVYTSLNEGFGYPPLEAMRFGVPVIASSFTSIAEVCGDGALYTNPFDVKEIKSRILRMLYDNNLYQTMSNKGKARYDEVTIKQRSDLEGLVRYILSLKK